MNKILNALTMIITFLSVSSYIMQLHKTIKVQSTTIDFLIGRVRFYEDNVSARYLLKRKADDM